MRKIKKHQKIICNECFKSIDVNEIGYESTDWPYRVVCEECVESQREDHDDEQSDGENS